MYYLTEKRYLFLILKKDIKYVTKVSLVTLTLFISTTAASFHMLFLGDVPGASLMYPIKGQGHPTFLAFIFQKSLDVDLQGSFSLFRMVQRSEADRWEVVTWHKEGLKPAEIVHKTGFTFDFVNRWIKRFEQAGTIQEERRSGRKRKHSEAADRAVETTMAGKQRRSTRVVARLLKKQKKADISYRTVSRIAHSRGLRPYRMQTGSRLTDTHRKKRLAFAKEIKNKDWSSTFFTDEHTFKQFKPANQMHDIVWAKNESQVPDREVERWGSSLNVWAGISSRGKTDIHFYNGTLKAEDYQNILEESLLPAAQEQFEDKGDEWELQQDKATCHVARSTTEWLEENGVTVFNSWPTKGDDINPVENLWAILDERLQARKFKTPAGMKKAIREEWNNIDQSTIDNLIESVPGRLRRVIKAKGGSIKRIHQHVETRSRC